MARIPLPLSFGSYPPLRYTCGDIQEMRNEQSL